VFVLYFVSNTQQNGQSFFSDFYALGICTLLFVFLIVLFLTDSFYKDLRQNQKIIIRTIIKHHNYETNVPFSGSIKSKATLPFPIDFELRKLKYFDALRQKNTIFETKKSKFRFKLSNKLSYDIYESDFVSENSGTLLELHVAKNSGFVVSFRKMKPDEIGKKELAEIKSKLYPNNKPLCKENAFENLDSPDEIK